MHDEALRLIDDDDVLVLEDDIERDILTLRLRWGGLGDVDCDRIPSRDMISGVADGGALGCDGTARISAFSRERDSSGRSTASTRSRRGEPSSPPTVTSSL